MPIMKLIWVTTGKHPTSEKIICKATRSIYSHAAVQLEIPKEITGLPTDDCIVEAVMPAVRYTDAAEYDAYFLKETYEVELTEDQHQDVLARAAELIGHPYGLDNCLVSGAHDVLGDFVSEMIDWAIDDEDSICFGSDQ